MGRGGKLIQVEIIDYRTAGGCSHGLACLHAKSNVRRLFVVVIGDDIIPAFFSWYAEDCQRVGVLNRFHEVHGDLLSVLVRRIAVSNAPHAR